MLVKVNCALREISTGSKEVPMVRFYWFLSSILVCGFSVTKYQLEMTIFVEEEPISRFIVLVPLRYERLSSSCWKCWICECLK
ncbi:hypothetical protein C492_10745 [Natronococcus jeotgali DSM 18795]|uniref:Uncharacterized protein n=1 Tax=Natronococcus jeotgali DSM 18795 TaxID=1227498 RepID=L9XEK9_9EURY|nr:hypothetical protein C492_10745 [Natronococcus jeotgali DSM 18795]